MSDPEFETLKSLVFAFAECQSRYELLVVQWGHAWATSQFYDMERAPSVGAADDALGVATEALCEWAAAHGWTFDPYRTWPEWRAGLWNPDQDPWSPESLAALAEHATSSAEPILEPDGATGRAPADGPELPDGAADGMVLMRPADPPGDL